MNSTTNQGHNQALGNKQQNRNQTILGFIGISLNDLTLKSSQ